MLLQKAQIGAGGCSPRWLPPHFNHWLENAGPDWRTFPILHQTASWTGDHFVVKASAIGQPTWPTQPSIPQGSVNE